MKATELIKQLQEAVDKYGDLPVTRLDERNRTVDVDDAHVLDSDDVSVESKRFNGNASEIYIG